MMKRVLLFMTVILFWGSILLWPGCGKAAEYEQGKNLYDNRCQICHGADGKGNGPASSSFTPRPVNLTGPKFWQQKDIDKTITNTIEHGHGMMPPMGLSPDQIKAVIDYLSHAFKPGS
jgi:mono/diheme cytochrome c family protein